MNENGQHILELEELELGFLKRNLADFLTFSRVIISLVILSLSFVGQSAYMSVVILTLVGGATDILDGNIARRFLGENREGRLGKHDAEIDTFFVLCVMAYFSFAGIAVQLAIGLGWIGLVVITYVLSRRSLKVLIVFEVITVIALLVITFLYNFRIFWLVIAPTMAAGIIINHRRLSYILFDYWPRLFSG
ncbi:CDP-alcohol phosphatidyltransferase family protein [Chloroflexota bacterium]